MLILRTAGELQTFTGAAFALRLSLVRERLGTSHRNENCTARSSPAWAESQTLSQLSARVATRAVTDVTEVRGCVTGALISLLYDHRSTRRDLALLPPPLHLRIPSHGEANDPQ